MRRTAKYLALVASMILLVSLTACIKTGTADYETATTEEGKAKTTFEKAVISMVGSDWLVVTSGDLNGDDIEEAVVYMPSKVVPSSIFSDPVYADYNIVAEEIVIAQKQNSGDPVVLLRVTTEEATAGEETLMTIEEEPVAFLARYAEDSYVPLVIVPLDSDGERESRGIGFDWDEDAESYSTVGVEDADNEDAEDEDAEDEDTEDEDTEDEDADNEDAE